MRPTPVRASDLRRRIEAEKACLSEVESRIAGATEGTVRDLTATEVHVANLDHVIDRCAEEQIALDEELRRARQHVAELERCATALAVRVANAKYDRDAATRIVQSLREKVAEERASLAPVEQRHRKEVERLERRLATVLAYHPEQRSNVLSDPTPGAGRVPAASTSASAEVAS